MRIILTLPVALCCISVAGCSWEPSRYPLKGTVTINGAPAALTHVIFIAVNPVTPTSSGGSTITDKDGNFVVPSADKAPGLIAGEYKVIFQQTLVNGKPVLGGGRKKNDRAPNEKEGVPEPYLLPDTTPQRITVRSKMEPVKFELTR